MAGIFDAIFVIVFNSAGFTMRYARVNPSAGVIINSFHIPWQNVRVFLTPPVYDYFFIRFKPSSHYILFQMQ